MNGTDEYVGREAKPEAEFEYAPEKGTHLGENEGKRNWNSEASDQRAEDEFSFLRIQRLPGPTHQAPPASGNAAVVIGDEYSRVSMPWV